MRGPERSPAAVAHARLLIFDADDTLRRTTVPNQPCPHADDEWELLPGVREVLSAIDWDSERQRLGIASNQDHVGHGLLAERTAFELLERLVERATGRPAPPGSIRLCPHRPEAGCRCRKPEPGMLLDLIRHYGVEPHETVFIGDAETDRIAARRAGTGFLWAHEFFGGSQ